jgi:hypothetical protein
LSLPFLGPRFSSVTPRPLISSAGRASVLARRVASKNEVTVVFVIAMFVYVGDASEKQQYFQDYRR